MKNLWKAADGKENNAKFIWQEVSRLPQSDDIAALHADTKERLDELQQERNFSDTRLKVIAGQAVKLVDDKSSAIEENFTEANISKAAQLTRFAGQGEAGKLARVEMISRINDGTISTGSLDTAQISQFFEESMRPLRCKGGPRHYINIAQKMVKYGDTAHIPSTYLNMFNSPTGRQKLADIMKKDGSDSGFDLNGNLLLNEKSLHVVDCEILMGGAMTNVSPSYLSEFKLKNVIDMGDGKYMGFMKNGCQGNLVIIDTKEKSNPEITCPDGSHPEMFNGQWICIVDENILDDNIEEVRSCENGFIVIRNKKTGALISTTSEKCNDDPSKKCEVDCDDHFIAKRIGTAKEAWDEVEAKEKETDASEKAVNEFFAEFWGKDGIAAKLKIESMLMGGVSGPLVAVILTAASDKFDGVDTSGYKIVKERISSVFAKAKKANDKIKKKIEGGIWNQTKGNIVKDLVTWAVGIALGGGVIGSAPITNIRARWISSKAEETIGMDEVRDVLGDLSYTESFGKYMNDLNNERLAQLNAAKFENGENETLQNEKLEATAARKLTQIKTIMGSLGLRSGVYAHESRAGKRTSFGLFEDWFKGKRTKVKKSREILEKYNEYLNSVTDEQALNDYEKLTEAETATKDILDTFVAEFKDDYDQPNFAPAELGKRAESWEKMEFTIKGKEVSIKLQTLEEIDKDGKQVLDANGKPKIKVSWNNNVTIDGIEYGPEADGAVRSMEDLSRQDRKIYRKAQRKLKKLDGRLAMVKQFHWMATQMEDLNTQKDILQVDHKIFKNEEGNSLENSESTASYAQMALLNELWNKEDEKVNAERIIDCHFENSQAMLKGFLNTEYKNETTKLESWHELYSNKEFQTDLKKYNEAVNAQIDKDGVFYNADGTKCDLEMDEVYARLKKGERFYYDNVFKEKSLYIPLTLNAFEIFEKETVDVTETIETPKAFGTPAYNASLNSAGEFSEETLRGYLANSPVPEVNALANFTQVFHSNGSITGFLIKTGENELKKITAESLGTSLAPSIIGAMTPSLGKNYKNVMKKSKYRVVEQQYDKTSNNIPETSNASTDTTKEDSPSSENSENNTNDPNKSSVENSENNYLDGYQTDLSSWDFSKVETDEQKVAGIKKLDSGEFQVVFEDKTTMIGTYDFADNGKYQFNVPNNPSSNKTESTKPESNNEKKDKLPEGFSAENLAKYSNLPEGTIAVKESGRRNLTILLKNGEQIVGKLKAVAGTTIRKFEKNKN